MTVDIESRQDQDALTYTFVMQFDASVERVWQVWEDPRQLERWWGPPTWPATFDQHELSVGSESKYYMTGPDGDTAPGWWVIDLVEPHTRIEFTDGFSDRDRNHDDSLPRTHTVVTLDDLGGATRMTIVSRFGSFDQMKQLTEMGMLEGMTLALGQIEGILASTLKR